MPRHWPAPIAARDAVPAAEPRLLTTTGVGVRETPVVLATRAAPGTPSGTFERGRAWPLVDALRGVCLVFMAVNHFGGPLAPLFWQPVGFVSVAEVFFLLSGFVAGHSCTRVGLRTGGDLRPWDAGRRARRIYKAHLATVVLGALGLLASAALLPGQSAWHSAWPALFETPLAAIALAAGLLALPQPLDILPLYIVFVLLVPAIVRRCLAGRWRGVAMASIATWGVSQATLGHLAHWVARLAPALHPPGFDLLGYQIVFVAGVLLGWHVTVSGHIRLLRLGRTPLAVTISLAVVLLVLRRVVTGDSRLLEVLVGRPSFSPLRALNFALLVVLAVNARAWLAWALQRSPLALLGRQSIYAFSAHAVLLLWLRPWRGDIAARGPLVDVAATLAFLGAMLAVAWARERHRGAAV